MSKYDYMSYNEILGLFKTGRELLEWIKDGDWEGQLDCSTYECYFYSIKQAVNPIGYETPIPEDTMCEALDRTLRTGEVIELEPDEDFLPGGSRHDQLDGWTYHIVFREQEKYFQVETPPYPAESFENEQRAKSFVDSVEWHFAKTMPQIPHWYCLLKECEDKDEFLWFARYIWEHSIPGEFLGHTYKYFYLGTYKYWIMDPSPEECDLINRDEVK